MKNLFNQLYNYFENLPAKLMRHRFLVLVSTLVLTIVMSIGIAQNFSFDVSNEAWLEEGSTPLQVRKTFRQLFGSEDGVFIVYRPKSGDVFSESALKTLRALHKELEQAALRNDNVGEQLSRIVKLDSLYNARYQIADGDTIISKKLIGADFPETAEERENRRTIAGSQKNFRRLFYSEDFQYGGIQLKTDFGVVPVEKNDTDQLVSVGDLLADDDFELGGRDPLRETVDSSSEQLEFKKLAAEEYVYFMRALRSITEQEQYANFDFFFAGGAVSNEFLIEGSVNLGLLYTLMAAC